MSVAQSLGVAHTTVSRWETGDVPVNAEVLESLAKIYGISRRQIENPPEAAELIAFFDRAQHVVEGLDKDDLDRWLAIGESLVRK